MPIHENGQDKDGGVGAGGASEAVGAAAEAVGKSLATEAASTLVGAAVTVATGGNVVLGMAAGAAVGAAIDAAPQLADAAKRVVDEAGAALSSAFGLADPAPAPIAKPSAVGVATEKHVVAPTAAALAVSSSVLTSTGHTLASARGGIVAPPSSPAIQAQAEEIAKTSENTNIGKAAHEAVKVDSRAISAFQEIKTLLLDSSKTNEEKLAAISGISDVDVVDDSSFKAFFGIVQAALGMSESKNADGKTSDNASKFLSALSDKFLPIFAPAPGDSREGGAKEMNAAFAACGDAMQVGIGNLPAMQAAIEASFKSGFAEATKAAEAAKLEEEAKKARMPGGASATAEAPAAVSKAIPQELSLKEIGKDSLKIAGSIALSLLVPGGFLIAMAACYMLRDKIPAREESLPDIDASLPSGAGVPKAVRASTAESSAVGVPPMVTAPSGVAPSSATTTSVISSGVAGVAPTTFGAVPPPVVAFKDPSAVATAAAAARAAGVVGVLAGLEATSVSRAEPPTSGAGIATVVAGDGRGI